MHDFGVLSLSLISRADRTSPWGHFVLWKKIRQEGKMPVKQGCEIKNVLTAR
jgi:hypothetical protein